jgi:hypothetical protein
MSDDIRAFRGASGKRYLVAPEKALLYLATRIEADSSDRKRLTVVIQESLRWHLVLDLAKRHGVENLVRSRLASRECATFVPEWVKARLDDIHRKSVEAQLRLGEQLATLIQALEAEGCEPLLLKGAALAATSYDDAVHRPMTDIDVLVRPRHIVRALVVLSRLGYERLPMYYSDVFNSSHGYHYPFVDPHRNRLPVELHWDLASRVERRNRLSVTMLYQWAIEFTVRAGDLVCQARGLCPEARLVYLSTHAATEGHAFGRLLWIVDLSKVVASAPAIQWSQVERFARMARACTATYYALKLAADLLDAPVPAMTLAKLQPRGPTTLLVERVLNPITMLDAVDGTRRAIVKYVVVDNPAVATRLVFERFFPAPYDLRSRDPSSATRGLVDSYVRHAAHIGKGAARKLGGYVQKIGVSDR